MSENASEERKLVRITWEETVVKTATSTSPTPTVFIDGELHDNHDSSGVAPEPSMATGSSEPTQHGALGSLLRAFRFPPV